MIYVYLHALNLISRMKLLVILCILLLSQSCSNGQGNKLIAKNLTIHFDQKEVENKANLLGKFWENKGLVGERPQSIKLTRSEGTFYIHLIISEEFKESELVFDEKKLLLDLQREIDTTIFKGEKGCQILVCDADFKPISNINK